MRVAGADELPLAFAVRAPVSWVLIGEWAEAAVSFITAPRTTSSSGGAPFKERNTKKREPEFSLDRSCPHPAPPDGAEAE